MASAQTSVNEAPGTGWPQKRSRGWTVGSATPTPRGRFRIFAIALWFAMCAIFLRSPTLQINDSWYSMLTGESLLRNGTPDLSRYLIPDFETELPFATVRGNHAYQLVRVNGRLLYGFAHGSSFLSVPFLALLNRFGISPAAHAGEFDARGEAFIQKILAAVVSASTVTMFFLTAALVLSSPVSGLVAVGAGLGTQVWSTASRGMWEHTWEIMLGALVGYLLLKAEIRKTSVRPVLLATLLSWMFFVRPTGAIVVICVSAYVFACRRADFVPLAAVGAGWAAGFVAYSLKVFGTAVPFYYLSNDPHSLGFHPGMGLYGALLSPSRGVLIFCPIVGWVLFVVMRSWRCLKSRPLAITSLCVSGGILLASAAHPEWWGGACYGPRLLTDAVPWLVLLAILGIAAIPPGLRTLRHPMLAIGALLLLVSLAINGYGAWSSATMGWNFTGPSPDIMLDWSRPQFLAGWIHR
jgi:hypothetical protein